MKIIEKILSVSIAVLLMIVLGAAVLQYISSDGSLKQSISRVTGEAGDAVSSAASQISVQIAKEIGDSSSGTKSDGSANAAGTKPAIPLAAKITTAPASSEAQSKVSAPVSAADLQNVWGSTGMRGLTVYEYGKTLLNDTEKSCYNQIAAAVQNVNTQVTIITTLSPTRVKKIYEYYIYDHAEVFYMDGVSLRYYDSGDKYTYEITFTYKYNGDKSKISAMRSKLGQKALQALAAANGLSTDLKKEKALHDKLIELCSYDIEAAQNPDAYPESFSAYGALVNGNSVCQGYAQAMKLLLSSAGIKSLYITGQANGGGHAWNIVEIGGQWRYLDATFDDPVFTDAGGDYTSYNTVSYTYFNYKSKSDRTVGTFDSANPFSSASENYATMPKVS